MQRIVNGLYHLERFDSALHHDRQCCHKTIKILCIMKKNEEKMLNAVLHLNDFEESNTRVEVSKVNGKPRVDVYLFGNRIYTQAGRCKMFTLAGWDTITTRNRLRALGVNLCRKNGKNYYNMVEINKYDWYDFKGRKI